MHRAKNYTRAGFSLRQCSSIVAKSHTRLHSKLPTGPIGSLVCFSSSTVTVPSKNASTVGGIWLNLSKDERTFFTSAWLRDNCRCPQCFFPQTQQRQADTLRQSLTASVATVRTVTGSIEVVWSDGHVSSFESGWLARHAFHIEQTEHRAAPSTQPLDGRAVTAEAGELSFIPEQALVSPVVGRERPAPLSARSVASGGRALLYNVTPPYATVAEDPAEDAQSQILWKAATFSQKDDRSPAVGLPVVSATGTTAQGAVRAMQGAMQGQTQVDEGYLTSDKGVYRALQCIRDYGFVLVEGVEPTMAATEAAARRIGPPMRTLYSEEGMWKTELRLDPAQAHTVNDTAFTSLPLAAHTDGNYCLETPGLQCFHALKADSTGGGRTQLIDGFAAARHLQATQPQAFDTLATLLLPFHHTEPNSMVWAYKHVLNCGHGTRNGRHLSSIHWNADDRAPYTGGPQPSEAASDVLQFYSAVHHWQTVLNLPAFSLWLDLRPGNLLIFNNLRTLHGRSGVHPASGRILAGCYHSTEDWKSKLRVLHHRLAGPAAKA